MRFELSIEMNDKAMRRRYHVAEALDAVARQVISLPSDKRDASGPVLDRYGTKVGEWRFVESKP